MEAGRVAALRGHKVVIYEKSDKLGGHVTEAVVMPFKEGEQKLLDWYITELGDLKVEIRLRTEVTSGDRSQEQPGRSYCCHRIKVRPFECSGGR